MNGEETAKGCIYTLREDGIHHFVFTGKTDTGLDEFFAQLETILRSSPVNSTLRYLVDMTGVQGRMPLRMLIQRFRKLEVQIPERGRGRTAIIHKPGFFTSLAGTMVDTLAPGQDRTHFFTPNQQDQAIAWLLAER